MTARRVAVLGSGIAGTAAAIAAARAGAEVTIVRGRPGATSLSGGAIDSGSWEDGPAAAALAPEARGVLDALGGFALGECTLATTGGVIRRADGRDAALLDLGAGAGAVLVVAVEHPGWHAMTLARHLGAYGERDFVARPASLFVHARERAMHHAELAALHDDDARLDHAAERIRAALAQGGTFSAVLLPPWLGCDAPRARALSERVGVACGEALVGHDGPSGLRFERARDRCLRAAKVEARLGLVRRVAAKTDGCTVTLEAGDAIEADAVVLATGGLVGGGIAYAPGEAVLATAVPPAPHGPFALTYEAPVTLGVRGRPLGIPGSLFGVPPEELTWPRSQTPAIEQVGVLVGSSLRAAPNLYVAGDAIADRRRGWLDALVSGAAAGHAAAAA
ncbi:MAG TPA: FAD-binding protein [Polyangiaceae bacterium]|nr:FAD-binding protein [Polyangiaceae bacterium]